MQPIAEVKVLDHGVVALMDFWGDDNRPATAARTSYRRDASEYTDEQNAKLTRYLLKNHHNTPVEFCGAQFYMELPLFVSAQLVRHRTASINQESFRYVEAREVFYVPADERMQKQSQTNKQGSAPELVDDVKHCKRLIQDAQTFAFETYRTLIEEGLAKELARTVLPVSTYTAWYWQANLHNIFHLFGLRLDPHAQHECRIYAQAMLDLLRPVFPTVIQAWEESRAV